MSSGLSMTSVNKIKELAQAREYSLALDIIEKQDLTKSLNPQFLKVCADVYVQCGRYIEARNVLVMAHRLAPQAKRIIAAIVDLYYRRGFFELAKKYYDIYMADAEEQDAETIQMIYRKRKAEGASYDELSEILSNYYIDNMDYDWSYETFVLCCLRNDKSLIDRIKLDYVATYKNTVYADKVSRIDSKDFSDDVKEALLKEFKIYSAEEVADDNAEEESVREEESKLLEADDLRIHPREPEIKIMVDDNEEALVGSKHKLKKFLKEQGKLEREKEVNEDADTDSEFISQTEAIDNDQAESATATEESPEAERTKTSIFKGLFSKKKNKKSDIQETVEKTETAEVEEETKTAEVEEETKTAEVEEETKTAEVEEETETAEVEEETKTAEVEEETETAEVEEETKTAEVEEETETAEVEEETETAATAEKQLQDTEETGVDEILTQEIYSNKEETEVGEKRAIIVSTDEDDDFAAEADTIEELCKETAEESSIENTSDAAVEAKPMFVFEEMELDTDDYDEEYEIDDFSSQENDEFFETDIARKVDDSTEYKINIDDIKVVDAEKPSSEENEEYTEAEIEVEEEIEEEPETEVEEEIEEEPETEVEEEIEEEPETEVEEEIEVEPETEVEEEIEVEPETEVEVEIDEEPETEVEEEIDEEPETEVEEEIDEEPETEVEEEIEVEPETEVEEEIEVEPETEVEEEIEEEPETEVEEEIEVEPETEAEKEIEEESETEVEEEIEVEPETEVEEEIEEEPETEVEEEIEVEPETEAEEEIEVEPETEAEEEIDEEPEAEVEEETSELDIEEDSDDFENENLDESIDEMLETISKEKKDSPNPGKSNYSFENERKSAMDFPVFKSSLFPTYHNERQEINNDFDKIVNDAQNKMRENMLKEAQMQREAEQLLASLGINIEGMEGSNDEKKSLNEMSKKDNSLSYTEEKGLSRDEVKASLVIDGKKKNILKKLKEYR